MIPHFTLHNLAQRLCLPLSFMVLFALSACTSTGTNPPPSAVPREAKIGLALGGGAARGFAHIGVIQALEEAGIRPHLVVGTSAGSLVAALYASGKNGRELATLAEGMNQSVIADWGVPIFGRGALRGQALSDYMNKAVNNRTIESMPMPLGIVATNLRTGEGILFQRGNVGTAVRASSSVPAVFQPVKIGAQEYVDGGLVAPVPVEYARKMGANVVIGVDISSPPEDGATDGTFSILMQTFSIMGKSINRHELNMADVVVRPNLAGLKSTDFSNKQRSIDAGRAAMRAVIPKLKAKIASPD